MVKIKVPATSANIGPGFDSIGLALNIFNTIEVNKKTDGFQIDFKGDFTIDKAENLTLIAMDFVAQKYNLTYEGYHLIIHEPQIPLSRGLGSSAAAIVCGIYAASYLLDLNLSRKDMIILATEMEGHPDNVVPAILGNMVISYYANNEVVYSVVDFPDDILFKVLIPEFKLSTEKARAALPDHYTRQTCINNIAKTALLVNAIQTRHYELLKVALQDEIHEPYRLPLIPDADALIHAIKATNVLGTFISGAGPTLIALVDAENDYFADSLSPSLKDLTVPWDILSITVNKNGSEMILE